MYAFFGRLKLTLAKKNFGYACPSQVQILVPSLSMKFQTIPIWVQVWGLPFELINEEAGRDIRRGISRVSEVDCKAIAADQAKFLRVRVDMLLDKLIRHGAPVLSPKGDTVWVAFQYKRLLRLCFRCGLLGHEAKTCLGPEDLPYED